MANMVKVMVLFMSLPLVHETYLHIWTSEQKFLPAPIPFVMQPYMQPANWHHGKWFVTTL